MARANLNKSKFFLTNTTMASKYYIPKCPESALIEIPLSFFLHKSNHNICLYISGTKLASGSDDLNIIVWDWQQKKKLTTFPTGHRENVFQVVLGVDLYNLPTKKLRR